MRLIDRGLLKEFIAEAPALFTIIGVTTAIMVGLLVGVYLTDKFLTAFIESLGLFK